MEVLKEFKDIGTVDPRVARFARIDNSSKGYHPITIEEWYETATDLKLNSTAPEDVQSMFSMALNMWLYSWFYYPLNSEAGFLAIRALENALKQRLSIKKSCGLKFLLKQAVDKGLFKEEKFTRDEVPEEVVKYFEKRAGKPLRTQPDTFIQDLPETLSSIRNSYAHGDLNIHLYGAKQLRLISEIINQLYTE